MEAVILAGGMGTRLQSVINQIPKPMADINGKPFLEYLLKRLINKGVTDFVFSVGYKYQIIQEYFGDSYQGCKIKYAIEEVPLGTGGGIIKSLQFCSQNDVLVLNGDTFFDIDFSGLYKSYSDQKSAITIALRKVDDISRFGSVSYDNMHLVTGFLEKSIVSGEGFINGGIYLLNRKSILDLNFPEKFSFEKDFLEQYFSKLTMNVFLSDTYFIDIGIPTEYEKAKDDFKRFDN